MLNMNTMTLQERIHRRSGHIAVTYKNSLVIWGGFMETGSGLPSALQTQEYCVYHYTDEIWVYQHDTELWERLLTSGDVPPPTCGSCGVVLADSLYVFGGFCQGDSLFGNSNRLYRLDLRRLEWRLLSPDGQAPTACDKLVGWAHRDRVYFFGGFGPTPNFFPSFSFVLDPSTDGLSEQRGWNNQLIAYEPETNTWAWPKVSGDPPCPRAAHSADITGDKVYIFGGRFMLSRRNDLYCLNLSTMSWSGVLLSSPPEGQEMPSGRSWHSFTFISPTRAIVYGGLSNHNVILNDCWSIDVELRRATRLFPSHPDEGDKKARTCGGGRFWHRVAASPGRDVLSVVGGTVPHRSRVHNLRDHAEELLVLEFTPKSLFRLSMDTVLMDVPVKLWFEQHLLPRAVEDILVLRLEQNPTLSLL